MSRSYRQISQLKEITRQPNSTINVHIHVRNKSLQTKNFDHLLQKGREFYRSNQVATAIQYLERGLYYDPDLVQLNFMLGVSHLSLNHYAEALRYLGRVNKINHKYESNLSLLISIAHNKIGNTQAAVQAINSADSTVQSQQSLFYRAKLHYKAKRYTQAMTDINCILGRNGKHGPSFMLKLKVLEAQGNYTQALSVVELGRLNVQQLDRQQQIRLQQTLILISLGRYESAMTCLQQIEKEFIIIGSELHFIRGKLLQKMGRIQEAVIVYNQLLSKNIHSRVYCQAIAEVSICYMKERDFYEAFTYLKRTNLLRVKSKPTDNLLRLAEGVTFLMKKKYAEAILLIGSCELDFKYSLREHSSFLQNLSFNALGFANFSLGNHDTALQLYRRIDKGDPSTDMVAAQYNISICEGIMYYRKKNSDQSLRCFQRAFSYIARPQPYFYIAVVLNQKYMDENLNTEAFIRILQIVQKGLRAGQSAHIYYYRSIIYLFLGMNAEALQDIDRAIEKSQDNVAKYFHTRGVIFMLDKNYDQAMMQFSTALSIDDKNDISAIEKGKCELMGGDSESAYNSIMGIAQESIWRTYFNLYQKNYSFILENEECENQSVLHVCNFMRGRFEQAGPSGKLIIAILYENYSEVIKLIEEAVGLSVSVGCLQLNDLLMLKAYSEYRLSLFEEAILTLIRVQRTLRESSSKAESYCEQQQRKLLLCKVDIILINYRRGHNIQALQLTDELLGQVCDGPILDQLTKFKQFLVQSTGEYEVGLSFDTQMISDYFQTEQFLSLKFKFLVPMPSYHVMQVQFPQYEDLLTNFKVDDIENKPQAPWIKRGQFGILFTNDIQEYENLNLRTEENEAAVRSKMPSGANSRVIQTKSKLMKDLRLSNSVVEKLQRLAYRNKVEM